MKRATCPSPNRACYHFAWLRTCARTPFLPLSVVDCGVEFAEDVPNLISHDLQVDDDARNMQTYSSFIPI